MDEERILLLIFHDDERNEANLDEPGNAEAGMQILEWDLRKTIIRHGVARRS